MATGVHLSEHQWIGVYQAVLGKAGIGVVVTDDNDLILGHNRDGLRILGMLATSVDRELGSALPAPLPAIVAEARSAQDHDDRPSATPVHLTNGRVAYCTVAFPGVPTPSAAVITLRLGELRGEELIRRLRQQFDISSREAQLVQMLRQAKTNKQIADCLGLTEGTVKNYVHVLYQKLGIQSRASLPPLLDNL